MTTPFHANCGLIGTVKSTHDVLRKRKTRGQRRPMWAASALLVLLILLAIPASSQPLLYPSSASTRLYFAQLADGGPAEQKWSTTILFVNPSTTAAASVTVSFYDNNGQPLLLDFGQGASAVLNVNLPAGSARSYTTTGAARQTVVGWGSAVSDIPVTGTLLYRSMQGLAPKWDVAAAGTGSTYLYSSYANANLGLALANPGTGTIHLTVAAKDQSGNVVGAGTPITLAPQGHTAFNLWDSPTSLPSGFTGSITVTSRDTPPTPFVGWTLNIRDDLLSPLPPGEMLSPAPPDRRPYDFAVRLRAAAMPVVQAVAADPRNFTIVTPGQIAQYLAAMDILIDSGLTTIKASFRQDDKRVVLSSLMLETMSGSDGALAFLIAREVVRGIVILSGHPATDMFLGVADPEAAVDAWAILTLMKAGFDPTGAADCYARLVLANIRQIPIDASTVTEFAIPNGMSGRLQTSFGYVQQMYNVYPALAQDAAAVHNLWHPHYPAQLP